MPERNVFKHVVIIGTGPTELYSFFINSDRCAATHRNPRTCGGRGRRHALQ